MQFFAWRKVFLFILHGTIKSFCVDELHVINVISTKCKELLIDYKATHSCRRAYASKLIENNAQKGVVMKAMGHNSLETTIRYYYEKDELDNSELLVLKTLIEA